MTTKFITLISVIGLASICLVQGQSPTPGESPAASPSPAAEATASPSPTAKPTRTPKATPAKRATPAAATTATPAAVGGRGLVWVSTDTHTYYKEGSRFYGKTKGGKYMSEADARKEGNRPAREENF
jgi:hypothetical protein